jgi:hypothetical protein
MPSESSTLIFSRNLDLIHYVRTIRMIANLKTFPSNVNNCTYLTTDYCVAILSIHTFKTWKIPNKMDLWDINNLTRPRVLNVWDNCEAVFWWFLIRIQRYRRHTYLCDMCKWFWSHFTLFDLKNNNKEKKGTVCVMYYTFSLRKWRRYFFVITRTCCYYFQVHAFL